MKIYCSLMAVALASFSASPLSTQAQAARRFVYETPLEFFGQGDFDGDGRTDFAIVDKNTGKYRLGYQTAEGTISWVDNRPSGIKSLTGFTLGKLLSTNVDALGFTSPDANQITVVNVSNRESSARAVTVPFTAALGPNTLVAIDIGGEKNTPLADFFVGSIQNSPDPNLLNLLRNDGAEFPSVADATLTGPAVRANAIVLKPGQSEMVCYLVSQETNSTLYVEDLSGGKQLQIIKEGDLPAGCDYAVGNFRGSPLSELLLYTPGQSKIIVKAIEEADPPKYRLGPAKTFDLGQPVRRVVTLEPGKLFVIFDEGEKAGVYAFDGQNAPSLKQTILATNELWTCAVNVAGGLVAFSQPPGGKLSTRYYAYKSGPDTYSFSVFGGLPSLADNDNVTIPEIAQQILSRISVTNESQMTRYTNTIPGTEITYAMVPIPGGEFVMGSSKSQSSSKPDETPQHNVKISPFWMGQFEVSWSEYELFMYPDEERRMRANHVNEAGSDKLADAVTHPSKPYVEMSFGMGKDGYPAISMTQHGANKYCQWLSAKTGEFYRLPTEAEWEYACRAGTTSTFFFGEDASKIGEYAWYEQNSDFKYQKIGKKKPNPWGLYDIYGNVVEWVLDQYDPDFYKQCVTLGTVSDPWNKATKPYPHSVRGGSWDDEVSRCRSTARRGSDRSWKMQDPQLPKSIWFHSDAQWVGFRLVRPLNIPSPEQIQKYWSSGVEKD
jgi:formylglycine-generating enzyme required for sulfatase activity